MLRLPKTPEEKRIETELTTLGVSVGQPYTDTGMRRAVLCLIRGLLVFLSTFGTIGGLTHAFGLEFNPLTIGIALFVISVVICFTYFNKITFYTGYVLIFMAFLVLYVVAYSHINSGFQAFLNEVYKAYSDFFNLPSTRETTEYITDRSVTVPAAMLFTGAGFAILLNISISAYMDLFSTFLLTFLPMQLAFYIDIIPPMPYLVMLITVYIAVEILSRSGRFRLPYRYKKGQQFAMMVGNGRRFSLRPARKTIRYEYLASGRGMLQEAVAGVAASALLMLLLSTMFAGRFTTKYVSNRIKDATDGYVKMLAQGGITSLFNRYTATGGISHGRLGGISSVAPDYETDIIVRLIPTSVGESGGRISPLYLKAYTGVYYDKNRFYESVPGKNEATADIADQRYIPSGANYMDTDRVAYMKLWLLNVDADNYYDYRPYYTLYSSSGRGEKFTGIGTAALIYALTDLHASEEADKDKDKMAEWVIAHKDDPESSPSSYELIYTPFTENAYYEPNPTVDDDSDASVYEDYLAVPKELEGTLDIAIREAGLDKITVDPSDTVLTGINPKYKEYIVGQSKRLLILQALRDHFEQDYQYSMMPGTTPFNRDTVDYFLSEQKRGYCVHFAASSTLILRRMGIPARYVEGYVVNPSDIVDGEIYKEPASDWIIGADGLDISATEAVTGSDGEEALKPGQIAVVDAEIPDANAHAWTEVYIDGYGWIPYEFTPPSDEEDLRLGGFGDFLARLFAATNRNRGNGSETGSEAGRINPGTGALKGLRNSRIFKIFGSVDFILLPVIIVLGTVALMILAIEAFKILKWRYRLSRLLKDGNYNDALLMQYLRFLKSLRRKGIITDPYPTISEVSEELTKVPGFKSDIKNDIPIRDSLDVVSRAAYSPMQITPDEYTATLKTMQSIIR